MQLTREFLFQHIREGLFKHIWSLAAVIALIAAFASTVIEIHLPNVKDDGMVAYVNSAGISESEYARALSAMQAGLKRHLSQEDKARALSLLINEELIVQKAIDLGLAREDRLIRKNLVQAMIRSVIALDTAEPDDEKLRTFFAREKQLFTRPPLFSLAAFTVKTEKSARLAKKSLEQGEAFSITQKSTPAKIVELSPQLPLGKLANLLGEAVANIIAEMHIGDIVGPIPYHEGFLFLWLGEKQESASDFETLRPVIEAEWQRREDEKAFDAYAARLRNAARITVAK